MENNVKKLDYKKPVLTKHAQLREVTLASTSTPGRPPVVSPS